MTWHKTLPLSILALGLLAGCEEDLPAPPPAPQPLAQPALSASDISDMQKHAYDAGYAAGRNYQKQLDIQAAADQDATKQGSAAQASAPQAPAPVQPVPPPTETYSPKGPAKPVATPMD